ncbi:nicotinate (nicotinamide) nucleotide adenylyltransferase, partial [bacterium]
RVVFVPAYLPPHKDTSDIAQASVRLEMIKMAIKGNKYFHVSDVEIKRKGKSYTIDTIREFNRNFPKDELYFITGSDLLSYLNEWKDLEEVIKIVKFVVATRPGYPLEKIPSYIKTVAIRAVDISAFEVRVCVKENKSFRYLVPEAVCSYIVKKRLYK